ncbi:MAG: DNA mismatch repair endonuclease MutL [Spirochaetota bacterium]|nr:DNA mismatch repair endonuclease MutL [Spirochaetota bacterium]
MKKEQLQSRRIHILRDSVAQKIAAGEVIDRPFSVVRELLDNSLDSGADSIDVYVEEGGLKRIRVIDNGEGMTREDLELCYLPHATSKITSAGDIYRLRTLGFRGEALSSMAACARLLITSSTEAGPPHTLEVRNGSPLRLELSGGTAGTTVEVSDLFYSMPGRKKFLKSSGAESSACFRTFLEKALPFPSVQFRFFTNDRMKLFLPSSGLRERVAQAFTDQLDLQLLHEISAEAGRFSIRAVFSSPSIHQRDRRLIYIYVNKRRIQEYSLVQAVHYAYDELLPGGSFPAAFVFLEIDPDLVDFNIHPAKREVKIKNLSEVHHQLVHSLKEYLNRTFLVPDGWIGSREPASPSDPQGRSVQTGALSGTLPDFPLYEKGSKRPEVDIEEWRQFAAESSRRTVSSEYGVTADNRIRYLGQAFNLFLAAQVGDQLYLIDQHAAHERIIYDSLVEGPRKLQQLLVPFDFEIEEDQEQLLERRLPEFDEIGIRIEKKSRGRWSITHLPERFSGLEKNIVDFLREQNVPGQTMKARLFADLACKSAVKDGETLDPFSAEELVRKALKLPVPRCPHGRPVWLKISRDELFRAVERT